MKSRFEVKHYSGTAMGLAIVRKCAERMGGTTWWNLGSGKGALSGLSWQKQENDS